MQGLRKVFSNQEQQLNCIHNDDDDVVKNWHFLSYFISYILYYLNVLLLLRNNHLKDFRINTLVSSRKHTPFDHNLAANVDYRSQACS